jgi:antitoxin component of RelBE/YafQ-DinJ toxin-antitoxin module
MATENSRRFNSGKYGVPVSMRMDASLLAEVTAKAESLGIPISSYILALVTRQLDEADKIKDLKAHYRECVKSLIAKFAKSEKEAHLMADYFLEQLKSGTHE